MADATGTLLGLDGEYREGELPLLVTRRGMASWVGDHVRMLDRRALPHRQVELACRTVDEVAVAIETMAIQGAFTLAIAAGYGMALSASDGAASVDALRAAHRRLLATRPTGVALRRMLDATLTQAQCAFAAGSDWRAAVVATVDEQAARWARQALATARHALPLIPEGAGLLTHCFADRSLIYLLLEARRAGRTLDVYCSETRPYLQGARLTAMSVLQTGHPATLITDGMGGFLMREGKVGVFATAADLVCLDGTVCNKIGTYQYALAARENHLPYLVLRQSGPDVEMAGERDIRIEYRDPNPVLDFEGTRTTVPGVQALYPAFDVTPPELVTAVVTDRGVFTPSALRDYASRPAAASG
jgi:methylthioribose-1-phosphate isomerase